MTVASPSIGSCPSDSRSVDAYLAAQPPARRADVEALRTLVHDADPGLDEIVKWNSPNFVSDGVDRLTINAAGRGPVRLILHFGTERAEDAGAAPTFAGDPTGCSRGTPTSAPAWPCDRGRAGVEARCDRRGHSCVARRGVTRSGAGNSALVATVALSMTTIGIIGQDTSAARSRGRPSRTDTRWSSPTRAGPRRSPTSVASSARRACCDGGRGGRGGGCRGRDRAVQGLQLDPGRAARRQDRHRHEQLLLGARRPRSRLDEGHTVTGMLRGTCRPPRGRRASTTSTRSTSPSMAGRPVPPIVAHCPASDHPDAAAFVISSTTSSASTA